MRPYPRNGPQAAARIVALAMLADGQVSPSELEVLDAQGAAGRLGLSRSALHQVVHELCEDLLLRCGNDGLEVTRVDDATLASLLEGVDDPALRRTVWQLILAVVTADRLCSQGEAVVLRSAWERWGLDAAACEAPGRAAREASPAS